MYGQLGILNQQNQRSPTHIKALNGKRIIDIQPGYAHSLALSDNGCVYSAGRSRYGQCGQWNLISELQRKKIIQIAVGEEYSMFLDCDGVVFGCGCNSQGQLGLGYQNKDTSIMLTSITVFQKQNIKITKIAAGAWHTLAIDSECRTYAWGSNCNGQCGIDQPYQKYILSPKLISPSIRSRSSIKVVDIKCSWSHSLLETLNGAHFMFGRNQYNQVTLVQSEKDKIFKPTAIDHIFSQRVSRVDLGFDNTWIWTRRNIQWKEYEGSSNNMPTAVSGAM